MDEGSKDSRWSGVFTDLYDAMSCGVEWWDEERGSATARRGQDGEIAVGVQVEEMYGDEGILVM
jgi:hypothetical protein